MKIKIYRARSKRWFSPLAWIIRRSQKTSWNHYAIAYANSKGEQMISDAKRKGIRKVTDKKWSKEYLLVSFKTIDLPSIGPNEFEKFVDDKVGTKYSFMQLIGIAMISLGIKTKNPFGKNGKNLVCHEYVLVALKRFLRLEIRDSDDYDFALTEKVLEKL